MGKYDVDFKKLAILLLPTFLRKPLLAGFALAVIAPLAGTHANFRRYRDDKVYQLTHNGQVCYLRAVVNDMFDPINRGIEIVDADAMDGTEIYARSEGKWKMVPRRDTGTALVINRRGFDGTNGYDFIVKLPGDMILTDDDRKRMAAILNQYKIASKRFTII